MLFGKYLCGKRTECLSATISVDEFESLSKCILKVTTDKRNTSVPKETVHTSAFINFIVMRNLYENKFNPSLTDSNKRRIRSDAMRLARTILKALHD